MIALSIRQPWAWLIANGHKDIENRTWSTAIRGPFLIHAGKHIDYSGIVYVEEVFPHIVLPKTFEQGGIVGQAEITAVVEESASPWFFGPYGFVIQNAKPLPFREMRGWLGFFSPTGDF